ncbi:MAG TPA: aminotransferase class III-fold pyridoxal phosphate-dependent enzyme, partial [Leptolinea sp.]
YFQEIREICSRYDVLLIADEVMTGWGRTGKLWGIEHWGVTPDILTTAKGITGGYAPFSAIIAREFIWAILEEHHSPFKAGHTLNANAVSCAAAIEVINYIQKHHLTENSRLRGEQLITGLSKLMEKHSILGDVRGKGLMVGFELVKDRQTKEPFPPQIRLSAMFEKIALSNGLVTYPCTGSIDGALGDMVMLAPPLIITDQQIDDIVSIIEKTLIETESQLD